MSKKPVEFDDLGSDEDSEDEDYEPGSEESEPEQEPQELNVSSSKKRKCESGDEEVSGGLSDAEAQNEKDKQKETTVDAKKADEIWSSFLSDVKSEQVNKSKATTAPIDDKAKETIKEDQASTIATQAKSVQQQPKPVSKFSIAKAGGMASLLNKINKKPKINTLEESRQQWNEYKQSEDLNEELAAHSKGKSGFLERTAFLNRTDLREFEREKELRNKERSTRNSKLN